MSIRVHGAANQGPVEVDPNTLAAYLSARPDDFTTFGSYSVGISISMTPNLNTGWDSAITNAPILGFQWTSPGVACKLRRIVASVGSSGTAVAGVAGLQAFYARGYTQQYSLYTWDSTAAATTFIQSGANVVLGAGNRQRSTMPPSLMAGQVESIVENWPFGSNTITTGTPTPANVTPGTNIVTVKSAYSNSTNIAAAITGLAGGALTLDAQPFGNLSGSGTATAGTAPIPPAILYEAKAGEYPVLFDPFTGFVIQATMPGTSSSTQIFQCSFTIQWDELPAYY